MKIRKCRFCGGTEFVSGVQDFKAQITGTSSVMAGHLPLHHIICLNCGGVVHSYVIHPEKLLSRKQRKQRKQSQED